MAGRWQFNKADPSDVQKEVTQRDQFNNDDVDLPEALVREVIQNSSDAVHGKGPVRVHFKLKTLNKEEINELKLNLQSLEPHLAACDIKIPDDIEEVTRVLCIEDFNTSGLTGSYEHRDGENFEGFWRKMGASGKSGSKGGRRGLGKLTYSFSSKINVFFGLTVRVDDNIPSVMGQAVLSNHSIGLDYYSTHGFWFDQRSLNHLKLQLPVTNAKEVQEFQKLFGVYRTDQPGFSVVIPYLDDSITEDRILSGVIDNYYFPILAGQLEVEVGNVIVNASTFMEIAAQIAKRGSAIPFSFVKEISEAIASPDSVITAIGPVDRKRLGSEHLEDGQIEAMKSLFASGTLVHLRVPVALQPKGGSVRIGHIELFLKALAEGEAPFSLVARGPIVLPRERQFARLPARGALIALDEEAATFLGDAENPAHTGWNASAEKLTANWAGARDVLRAIRYSLADLHGLIAEQEERREDDALIDFFALADAKPTGKPARRRRRRTTNPQPERSEPAIRLEERVGGFVLFAGPGATNWSFPRRIRVTLAYDIVGGDPFRYFSRFDFDLTKPDGLAFDIAGGDMRATAANRLHFVVAEPDFRLEASGFDPRRDLVVSWRSP